MTTPSVGQFVYVLVPRTSNNGQDYASAVITQVFDGNVDCWHVNLTVFYDGTTPGVLMSIPLFVDRAAAEEYRAADARQHVTATTGTYFYAAYWAPRV